MSSAFIKAAFPAVAALGSAAIQAYSARATNEQNKQLAQENRDWQERMSDTATQRRVADLKAAGLNPMLATGSQASVPGGAQAVAQNEAQASIASALELYRTLADVHKTEVEAKAIARKSEGDVYGRGGEYFTVAENFAKEMLDKVVDSSSHAAKQVSKSYDSWNRKKYPIAKVGSPD